MKLDQNKLVLSIDEDYSSKIVILKRFSKSFTRSILTVNFFYYTWKIEVSEIYAMGTSASLSKIKIKKKMLDLLVKNWLDQV